MANALWDSTLPQAFQIDGYSETWPNEVVRSAMDVGPDKIRRRGPAIVTIVGSMIMTQTQVGTLKTFFETTLVGGALPFDWTTYRAEGSVTRTYRFTKPPKFTAVQVLAVWMVALELEQLP